MDHEKSESSAEARKGGLAEACNSVTKACLYLLAFLVPLAFAPFTLEFLEFNKQALIIGLTLIASAAWVLEMFLKKKVSIRKTPLGIMALAFIVAYGLSSWFSVDRYQSFFGSYDRSGSSFVTFACLAAIFFIAANNIRRLKEAKGMLMAFLASGFVASVFGILQMLGLHLLPFAATVQRSFNTVGTLNSLGIFSAVNLCLAVSLLLNPHLIEKEEEAGRGKSVTVRIFLVAALHLSLAVVVMVNYWALWTGIVLGMVVIIVFSNIRIREMKSINLLIIPVVLLILSVAMSFFRIPVNLELPVEIIPSQKASWRIAQSVLADDPAFGSGPGTFVLEYGRHRPITLNETAFWNTKFNKGNSEYITLLASSGLAGTVSWALMNVLFVVLGAYFFAKRKEGDEWFLNAAVFSAWAVLLASKFLYPANTVLEFYSWILMGIFAAIATKRAVGFGLAKSPRINFAVSFLVTLVVFAAGFSLFLEGRRYMAEVQYKRAQDLTQRGASLDEIIPLLKKSIALNGKQDTFYRNLAQAYLLKISQEISKEPGEETVQNIQLFTDSGIQAARKAADLSPSNSANWLTLGNIYQNIMPFIGGSDRWAQDSYEKAIGLEPNNPQFHTELGKVYLVRSDLIEDDGEESSMRLKSESLSSAQEKFEKAIELKQDYTPAHFQMALVHLRRGKNDKAVEEMELSRKYSPNDATIAFQLGTLYMELGKSREAVAELERAVSLVPTYSNARWYLASIYEREGNISKAVEHLSVVVQLNPDNRAAQDRLESLTGRKYAPPSPIIPDQPEEGAEGSGESEE